MKKSSAFVLSLIFLLLGIIAGLAFSPVKHVIGTNPVHKFHFCKGKEESALGETEEAE